MTRPVRLVRSDELANMAQPYAFPVFAECSGALTKPWRRAPWGGSLASRELDRTSEESVSGELPAATAAESQVELEDEFELAAQAQAEQEAALEALRQSAWQSGYDEGHRLGLEQGEAVLAEQQAQLAALLSTCQQSLQRLGPEVATSLRELAVMIAREVVRTELKVHPDAVLAVVQEVMDYAGPQQRVAQIRLNPEDLELVRQRLAETMAHLGFQLVADPTLQRGDVYLQGQHAEIDARLVTRWRRTLSNVGSSQPWQAPAFEAMPSPQHTPAVAPPILSPGSEPMLADTALWGQEDGL